jgi:hypothetical protein
VVTKCHLTKYSTLTAKFCHLKVLFFSFVTSRWGGGAAPTLILLPVGLFTLAEKQLYFLNYKFISYNHNIRRNKTSKFMFKESVQREGNRGQLLAQKIRAEKIYF